MTELKNFPDPQQDITQTGEQTLVLGGGCFWCTEAVYQALEGVLEVTSGYAGGTAQSANYEAVCTGQTDHAEVIEIRYDADRISLAQLLKVFFSVAHDPTQLDRQGNDRGRQYRSVVFYQSEPQAQMVRRYIQQLNDSGMFASPLVTTLEPLEEFYPAEQEHQDFAARNPQQPYIMFTSMPKVAKLKQAFADKLKR